MPDFEEEGIRLRRISGYYEYLPMGTVLNSRRLESSATPLSELSTSQSK
jgi:hypothetical protein